MSTPFEIERTYNAPVEKVWKAITDKNEMKKWYFDLEEFKPEVGFEFTFDAGDETKNVSFVHQCRVTEAIPNKKLSYTWKYRDYEGSSEVTFELFDEGGKTRLKLTHTGLESFPQNSPFFVRESFAQGWTDIIGRSLKEYLEN
ncbi:MAG: SRPBCC domain-containing protein [Bacteroidota bacterium]